MEFQLTRKYLEGEIESSKIALQKHKEGVRVHELVIKSFEEELATLLPEEKGVLISEEKEEPCTSTQPSED